MQKILTLLDVIMTFDELSDYVARHYGKRIGLAQEVSPSDNSLIIKADLK